MGTFLVAAALAGAGLAAGFFASSSELESDKQKLINTKSQIKKHTQKLVIIRLYQSSLNWMNPSLQQVWESQS